MSLKKVNYIDKQTKITASNLNEIQDAILENEAALKDKVSQAYVDNAVEGATAPAYAETVDDMKDQSKVYLGSNGNIWAYTAELTAQK